jgi:hypothetical protein
MHTSCILLYIYVTLIFDQKFCQVIELMVGGYRDGHESFVDVFHLIVMLFTLCDIPENSVARSFKCF